MVSVTLEWGHALQMMLALSQRRNALKAGIAAGRLTDDEAKKDLAATEAALERLQNASRDALAAVPVNMEPELEIL
jgi:hypothetical protein